MPILAFKGCLENIAKGKIAPRSLCNYYASLQVLQLQSFNSDDLPALWRDLLTKLLAGKSYFYIKHAIMLVKATLKYEGIRWTPTRDYYDLISELRNYGNIPAEGYNDQNIKQILEAI